MHQAVAKRRTSQEREQKPLEYEKGEKKKLGYSRTGQKEIEYSKSKQKKKSTQYSTPARALENLNLVSQPESNYPISLRALDSDIATPVKKTSKIPKISKRKPLKSLTFSPSPPIEHEQENSTPSAKKRKGDHLSKPKPTKSKKVQKLNQGYKRAQNFPQKPAKHLKTYPLWKF